MAVVVTDKCRLCRYTECVAVCPVSCFHGDGEQLYIDASVCIECQACVPVCPVHAIYDTDDLDRMRDHWVAVNAEQSQRLPVVARKQTPLPTADVRRAELGYKDGGRSRRHHVREGEE
jgi:ferredoxin